MTTESMEEAKCSQINCEKLKKLKDLNSCGGSELHLFLVG